MSARKVTEIVPIMVRMREGTRRALARKAEFNGNSLNAEINWRLDGSFIRDQQEERDSAIVNLLVGGSNISAEILRMIVFQLQHFPDWALRPDTIEAMANRIGEIVRNRPRNPLYMTGDEEDEL